MPIDLPLLPHAESFDDTWEFEPGDVVPSWLAHSKGLKALTFNERTTVFADLDGRFWVMPHHETSEPFHCLGYGADVPASVRCQGRGTCMILNAPMIRNAAFRSPS